MIVFELKYIFHDPEEINERCMGYFVSIECAKSHISTLKKEQMNQAISHEYLIIPHKVEDASQSVTRIYVAQVIFESNLYMGRETCCLGVFQDKDNALTCSETFTMLMDPKFSKNLIYTTSVSEYKVGR